MIAKKPALRWILVTVTAGALMSNTVSFSKDATAHNISYYPRALSEKAYAILCLTARVNKNPLKFGHSALSTFIIDKKQSNSRDLVSKQVSSVGLTPFKHKDGKKASNVEYNMVNDDPGDHYLKFEKSEEFPNTARHCVPITDKEARLLNNYVAQHKNDKWHLSDNCNDFSTEAFELATGIHFHSRSPLSAFVSMPGTVIHSIEKYQKDLKAPKTFKFKESRVLLLEEPSSNPKDSSERSKHGQN